ncbi:MAG: dihydrofolate reductase family protein [Candidatus Eremiobacteraeota bacterium]|nr:dihydrofolate reductase family protein [Candidatus Eremiobacteraeota bacterium]
MANIVLYLAASLDGFIADRDGGVDWITPFQNDDFGFQAFLETIDVLIMGRRTYDQARSFESWPYAGKRLILLTSKPVGSLPDGGEIVRGEISGLSARLRTHDGGDVWVAGGAKTMGAFLTAGEIDRIELHVLPLILGEGLRMFEGIGSTVPFHLENSTLFRNGIAKLTYARTSSVMPLH